MKLPTISLCVITGNEEATILRFLNSFAAAFDELCLVRATGAKQPDRTLELAADWCIKNGKTYRDGEYRNVRGITGRGDDEVDPNNPATWPHVDNFAAARNVAWELASSEWQFWADVDDVLIKPEPGKIGGAELIRLCAAAASHDYFLFKYSLRLQSESVVRERLFRTGIAKWIQPVHEQCRVLSDIFDGDRVKACIEERVIFEHLSGPEKERDPLRNRRIQEYSVRWLDAYAFELHREHFYAWQAHKKPEDREKALHWAEVTLKTKCLPQQKYDCLLNMAHVVSDDDPLHAVDLCWSAIRIDPKTRAAWGDLAFSYLLAGQPGPAEVATEFMQALPKPAASGYPVAEKWHGWRGADLRAQALRANGKEADARKFEANIFERNGRRFSLLHATRGRPEKAIEARANWLHGAYVPLGVEYIFAIDADDKESLEALKNYHHVVVKEPAGCVKAWNAAAAEACGHVLMQISDDWTPSHDWDCRVWDTLVHAGRKRAEAKGLTLPSDQQVMDAIPLVLAVSDNHRTDALLCMAILTRARYNEQRDTPGGPPHLFAPEYFGVFSDNEFTVRAYDDGVVIQARDIVFDHQHPIFAGKAVTEWDETYLRQNAAQRYRDGLAAFNRRNPQHAVEEKEVVS